MRIFAYVSMLFAAACASGGATFRSGVGDRQLEHPPYYAGQSLMTLQPAPRVALFPIEFQRGASQADIFDPASATGSAIAALLREMNLLMESVFSGARLAAAGAGGLLPPNVYFGCERDAGNDCVERGDSVLGRRGTTMRLAVERPSQAWITRTAAQFDSVGATHALLITLEVGQYWTRQSGIRGEKSVELGTNHVVSLPWLTSLETPVTVLQVTGALVGQDGRAVRIGAEGILAVRTPLIASAMGAQRILSPQDVDRARTLRHSDRPGQPLVWRSALCELLTQLTGTRCS